MRTAEETLELVRSRGGIPATCHCQGLPPSPAEAWNFNDDSESFGMTPVTLPPPHEVLVLMLWEQSPFDPDVRRVEVNVFGPEGCRHPKLAFNQRESAGAFVERVIAATDQAWAELP